MENKLLDVNDLEIKFYNEEGIVDAVNKASFDIDPGQSIGIVGESGCGKTVTAYSLLKILPPRGKITNGEILFQDKNKNILNLVDLDSESERMRTIRGAEISMIFQEPMSAFSPVHTIGNQIAENVLLHQDIAKHAARDRAIELLDRVGISNPPQRVDEYPFQFSGGMRQRAMIAMALACNPRLLVADEPTTALDVTIQAQVLHLIKEMQEEMGLSLMLITHDLGVIAHMVEQVYVMYLGKVVESGTVEEVFDEPKHPYTEDLMKSIPKASGTEGKLASIRGSVPDAVNLPSGCTFYPRCRKKIGEICETKIPGVTELESGREVRCFLYSKEGVKEDARNV